MSSTTAMRKRSAVFFQTYSACSRFMNRCRATRYMRPPSTGPSGIRFASPSPSAITKVQ